MSSGAVVGAATSGRSNRDVRAACAVTRQWPSRRSMTWRSGGNRKRERLPGVSHRASMTSRWSISIAGRSSTSSAKISTWSPLFSRGWCRARARAHPGVRRCRPPLSAPGAPRLGALHRVGRTRLAGCSRKRNCSSREAPRPGEKGQRASRASRVATPVPAHELVRTDVRELKAAIDGGR